MTTDKEPIDVHERPFFGVSWVIGVPFTFDTESGEDKKKASTEGVGEFMARIGGVAVDVPEFRDKVTRQVKVENEVPVFENKLGGGFDLEMNIPVTERLGYVTARGSINFGFDPNPWSLTLGYTLPISQFGSIATGGSGGK